LTEKQKEIVERTIKATQRIGGKNRVDDDETRLKRKKEQANFLELLGLKPRKNDQNENRG